MAKHLQNRNLKNVLAKAVQHENRLRLHGIAQPDAASVRANPAFTQFLQYAKSLVPADKYKAIVNQIRFPLPTTSLASSIYASLARIFEAKNAVEDYYFKDPDLAEDWAEYRDSKLNAQQIWRTVGFQKMQTSINSILVVDMPVAERKGRPEPYFYWVAVDNVESLECEGDKIDKIIFSFTAEDGEPRYAEITDAYYAVYRDLQDKNGTLESLNEHSLGYCPAAFFWTDAIDANIPILKASPLTKELGNLDKYLFKALSVDYFDLYASYPIISKWAEDCDYTEERNNLSVRCDGGYLRDDIGYLAGPEDGKEACPRCQGSLLAGPGSVLEVPLEANNGLTDAPSKVSLPGVTLTTVDATALAYNKKKVEDLAAAIIDSVAGVSTADTTEAINETQVKSKFEDKVDVLRAVKANFEAAQRFVESTICKLRYADDFLGLTINWGTEFYLEDSKTLYAKIKDAKDANMPEFVIAKLQDEILELTYRNNPVLLTRMRMLRQIEPYPLLTKEEVLALDWVEDTDKKVKLDFARLIARFENENVAITEFGADVELQKRIDIIKNTLKSYV